MNMEYIYLIVGQTSTSHGALLSPNTQKKTPINGAFQTLQLYSMVTVRMGYRRQSPLVAHCTEVDY